MMKKRLLSAFLAVMMIFAMLPTVFAADEETVVAKIGDKSYTSLQMAVDNAETGAVIVMENNTDISATGLTIISGKEVTLDLNGHEIKAANTNEGNIKVTGKLTLRDSTDTNKSGEGTGKIITDSKYVYNSSDKVLVSALNGEFVMESGLIDAATNIADNANYGQFAVGVENWTDNASVTINGGKIKAGWYAVAGNGRATSYSGNITINGGILESTTDYAIYHPQAGTTTINGGVIYGQAGGVAINRGKLVVNDGMITSKGIGNTGSWGDGTGNLKNAAIHANSKYSDVSVSVKGGKVIAEGNAVTIEQGTAHTATITISGGAFSSDPQDYLASGYIAKQNDDKLYEVTPVSSEETNKVIDAEVTTGTTTKAVSTEIQSDNEKNAAANQITVAPAENAALPAEAASPEEKAAAITKLGLTDGTIPENTTVTVTKTTYLAVEITDIDVHEETAKVTMEITPKYDLSATKETDGTQPVVANLVKGQEYKVTAPTVVEVKLPEVFKGKKVYITHKDDIYVVTAGEDGTVKFTTNGFSPFEFSLTAKDVAAEVGGAAYKDFQTAVTAAKDNETVYVIGSDTEYKATISGASKTIKVENGKSDTITVTINNTVKTIKPQETAEFTYTKPSSGSSSGSSSSKTTYKVTTSSVANGGVNVSPSSSAKGDKVKITLSPDKGYKLNKLTVTDASGKIVSTTKTSDTVYTFTMPASQVTVGVTYVKADETTEQPSTKTFSDVASTDWFADAVKYVSDKGMMNGTGNGKFSPADSTTRGMLMTVIARYAGQDTTGSNPWYQKGMEWAKANGVSDGTALNANITREQLVTMLYRYAKASGKDVSVGEDTNILSYADATTVSQYAIPAMQWACGAGIINGANGKLNPQNNATRAEVAAILMRFCENVK